MIWFLQARIILMYKFKNIDIHKGIVKDTVVHRQAREREGKSVSAAVTFSS